MEKIQKKTVTLSLSKDIHEECLKIAAENFLPFSTWLNQFLGLEIRRRKELEQQDEEIEDENEDNNPVDPVI